MNLTEENPVVHCLHLFQFAAALAVLIGILLGAGFVLAGPLLHTATAAAIGCLWPSAFFSWGSWRLARIRGARRMALFAQLNLWLCGLGLLMGVLQLRGITLPAPWEVLLGSISCALIGTQVLLVWEWLRRFNRWWVPPLWIVLGAAIASVIGMIYGETWEMLALVLAVLIGGPWLCFLLQFRSPCLWFAGRRLQFLYCTLVFCMPAVLTLVELTQRMHHARTTVIGTWSGSIDGRICRLELAADGHAHFSGGEAATQADWSGRWSVRLSPFSETPELLVHQDGAELTGWSPYTSGTHSLSLQGDVTVLLRKDQPAAGP